VAFAELSLRPGVDLSIGLRDCVIDREDTRLVGYFGEATEVEIPASVKSLESHCFRSCHSLVRDRFAGESELCAMDTGAFGGSENLESIVIQPKHFSDLTSHRPDILLIRVSNRATIFRLLVPLHFSIVNRSIGVCCVAWVRSCSTVIWMRDWEIGIMRSI
jgi:hypothetical protein